MRVLGKQRHMDEPVLIFTSYKMGVAACEYILNKEAAAVV